MDLGGIFLLNYEGIVYRIWAVGGVFVLLGIFGLVIAGIGRISFDKECFFMGILAILLGLYAGIEHTVYLHSPKVESFQAELYRQYRDSSTAAPLPFTWKYMFYDEIGQLYAVYLDTFAKKKIFPEDFQVGEVYKVYYEDHSDIILGVEKVSP